VIGVYAESRQEDFILSHGTPHRTAPPESRWACRCDEPTSAAILEEIATAALTGVPGTAKQLAGAADHFLAAVRRSSQ
jgi:hypothetical protein